MDDNLVEAMIMAFSVMIFVMALTLTLYMFSKVTYTSEVLIKNADTTKFYENVELRDIKITDSTLKEKIINGEYRVVDSSTVIPTLYRYYKENFCVKIYDASTQGVLTEEERSLERNPSNPSGEPGPALVQIFDMSLEGQVYKAVNDSNATWTGINSPTATDEEIASRRRNYALNQVYNKKPKPFKADWKSYDISDRIYMFGAPWVGSTENAKKRVDLFVSGKDGYINNQYVGYVGNSFFNSINMNDANNPRYAYLEKVVSYSYTGDTVETDEGEVLVTGAASKDKIVIIYIIVNNDDLLKLSNK